MKTDNAVSWQHEGKSETQRRTDALMAQKIDVAIIFQEMLGTSTAARYLSQQQVPLRIALRVLVHTRRNSPSPPKMIGCEELARRPARRPEPS
ncbi:hypothetical protein [Janthinobacterium sp. PC23-8]|uniref:hypothetical protein n=1 Tax=Janthinobacterium sp. PC23-8 TaxID=2012679 RepID=UPI00113FDD3F|nr:hypothetical protein [Janthinobacterium sp. PC23-8]